MKTNEHADEAVSSPSERRQTLVLLDSRERWNRVGGALSPSSSRRRRVCEDTVFEVGGGHAMHRAAAVRPRDRPEAARQQADSDTKLVTRKSRMSGSLRHDRWLPRSGAGRGRPDDRLAQRGRGHRVCGALRKSAALLGLQPASRSPIGGSGGVSCDPLLEWETPPVPRAGAAAIRCRRSGRSLV